MSLKGKSNRLFVTILAVVFVFSPIAVFPQVAAAALGDIQLTPKIPMNPDLSADYWGDVASFTYTGGPLNAWAGTDSDNAYTVTSVVFDLYYTGPNGYTYVWKSSEHGGCVTDSPVEVTPPDIVPGQYTVQAHHLGGCGVNHDHWWASPILFHYYPNYTGEPEAADVQLTVSGTPDTVVVYGDVTYTIKVLNNGPSTATNVQVLIDYYALDQVAVTPTQGSCNSPYAGHLVCSIGTMGLQSDGASISLKGQVNSRTTVPGLIAHEYADQYDPVPANWAAEVFTGLDFTADLAGSTSVTPNPVTLGGNITITSAVDNHGPSPAFDVTLTTFLQPETSYVSVSNSHGDCTVTPDASGNGSTYVTCNVGTILPGSRAQLAVIATQVARPASGVMYLTSIGTTGSNNDPDPDNNWGPVSYEVLGPSADLAVSLLDSPDPVVAKKSVTYTATVTNSGPNEAAGASYKAVLPSGVTFGSVSTTMGSCTSSNPGDGTTTVNCNLGTMAASSSATIRVVATPANVGSVTVTASVSSSTNDPNTSNNSASQTTTVAKASTSNKTPTPSPSPTPSPTPKPPTSAIYIALGDSIASGHGLMDTGAPCHNSSLAYPGTVLSNLRSRVKSVTWNSGTTNQTNVTFLACSGATALQGDADQSELASEPRMWLHNQVNDALTVIRNRKDPSKQPVLVTITVGADDYGWASADGLSTIMHLTADEFRTFITDKGVSVKLALETEVQTLLKEPNVYIVVAGYPNPLNRGSYFFSLALDPAYHSCYDLLYGMQECYTRSQDAVSYMNGYIAQVPGDVGATDRVAAVTDTIQNDFVNREGPVEACGIAGPAIADSWIQYAGDPESNSWLPLAGQAFWVANGAPAGPGDCFHPNQKGAVQIGRDVYAAAARLLHLQ